MPDSIELCPSTCEKWHNRKFVCNQYRIHRSTLARWIATGEIDVSRTGAIHCPSLRRFYRSGGARPARAVTTRPNAPG